MARNNVKLLTPVQRERINARYEFLYDAENNLVVVKIKNYTRQTVHTADKKFVIHSRARAFTFTPDAIAIWIELLQKNCAYTLVDIQNAVNKHYILYHDVTADSVLKMLSKEI